MRDGAKTSAIVSLEILLYAIQLHPASSVIPNETCTLYMGIVLVRRYCIVVISSGFTFSMLTDATISEHLISRSIDVHLKTRCSPVSRSLSRIEFLPSCS